MKKEYIEPLVEVSTQININNIICVSSENGTGADSGPTKHRHYYDPEEAEQKEPSYGNIW